MNAHWCCGFQGQKWARRKAAVVNDHWLLSVHRSSLCYLPWPTLCVIGVACGTGGICSRNQVAVV